MQGGGWRLEPHCPSCSPLVIKAPTNARGREILGARLWPWCRGLVSECPLARDSEELADSTWLPPWGATCPPQAAWGGPCSLLGNPKTECNEAEPNSWFESLKKSINIKRREKEKSAKGDKPIHKYQATDPALTTGTATLKGQRSNDKMEFVGNTGHHPRPKCVLAAGDALRMQAERWEETEEPRPRNGTWAEAQAATLTSDRRAFDSPKDKKNHKEPAQGRICTHACSLFIPNGPSRQPQMTGVWSQRVTC